MDNRKLIYREISSHGLLTGFYLSAGLEISEDWTKSSGVFLSEAVFYEGTEEKQSDINGSGWFPLAAYSLSKRYGVTVLDYIAVQDGQRQSGIGSAVLNRIKEKCRSNGIDSIYLTAKARDFFRKNGAKELGKGSSLYLPLLGECAGCEQRGKECDPEVMMIAVKV